MSSWEEVAQKFLEMALDKEVPSMDFLALAKAFRGMSLEQKEDFGLSIQQMDSIFQQLQLTEDEEGDMMDVDEISGPQTYPQSPMTLDSSQCLSSDSPLLTEANISRAERSSSARLQTMESVPVSSEEMSSPVDLEFELLPELVQKAMKVDIDLNFSDAFGIPFQTGHNPKTPGNSSHENLETSPEAVNSSDDSTDQDTDSRRFGTARRSRDDDLSYGGDESSGFESPALKPSKALSRKSGWDRAKRMTEDLNSSNSQDGSPEAEPRVRYYENPHYNMPPAKKAYERALRFSLIPRPPTPESERDNKIPDADHLVDLYSSLGMYDATKDDSNLESVYNKYRLDSILVRGVQQMSTDDIFRYFKAIHQNPIKMEWITDHMCIVIFEDKYEAGACLLNQSKLIDKNEDALDLGPEYMDYDNMSEIPFKEVRVSMPPSHTWRYANPSTGSTKAELIMTIAKKSDKKQIRAEGVSEYYRKFGNPNRGGGGYGKRSHDHPGRNKSNENSAHSSSSVSVSKFVEDRPPMHTRLNFGKGISRKRAAMDEEQDRRLSSKVSRRFSRSEYVSRNYEHAREDSSSDLDSDLRQLEEELSDPRRSRDSSRQSTAYEEDEDADEPVPRNSFQREREYRGRGNFGGRMNRGRRGGSIKDRLW